MSGLSSKVRISVSDPSSKSFGHLAIVATGCSRAALRCGCSRERHGPLTPPGATALGLKSMPAATEFFCVGDAIPRTVKDRAMRPARHFPNLPSLRCVQTGEPLPAGRP